MGHLFDLVFTSVGQADGVSRMRMLGMYRIGRLLLLTGCVPPALNPTARSELDAYVARPLQPSNCGTPDKPKSCKQRQERKQQREQEVHIIWNPEPFYPIIQEPLPDLTPLTRLKWPDE
jgi:hypothetical protein